MKTEQFSTSFPETLYRNVTGELTFMLTGVSSTTAGAVSFGGIIGGGNVWFIVNVKLAGANEVFPRLSFASQFHTIVWL